ncbi:unnamed protein product [Echinostoma caproni]|uniref:POLAc domain-containing protein n=1 Tax=Echinostoma caproni TaxID=27848 RepID=A0A183B671_9TREM|nr:unnamed protein product [Echinostoma caproni]
MKFRRHPPMTLQDALETGRKIEQFKNVLRAGLQILGGFVDSNHVDNQVSPEDIPTRASRPNGATVSTAGDSERVPLLVDTTEPVSRTFLTAQFIAMTQRVTLCYPLYYGGKAYKH